LAEGISLRSSSSSVISEAFRLWSSDSGKEKKDKTTLRKAKKIKMIYQRNESRIECKQGMKMAGLLQRPRRNPKFESKAIQEGIKQRSMS
jgi:hypothetical protein